MHAYDSKPNIVDTCGKKKETHLLKRYLGAEEFCFFLPSCTLQYVILYRYLEKTFDSDRSTH